MPASKRVFLSHVRDSKQFVEEFAEEFFTYDGCFRRDDWLVDNVLPGTKLHEELSRRIVSADVIIAFIDKTYSERIAGQEFRMAMDIRARRNTGLIIVPITLGISGRNWWKELQEDLSPGNPLADIVDWPFFIPGTDKYKYPHEEDGIHLIRDLREHLKEPPSRTTLPPDLPRAYSPLTILGDPKGIQSETVQQAADDLEVELCKDGIQVTRLPDNWETGGHGCQTEQILGDGTTTPLFVQPLAAIDASQYVRKPNRTINYLRNSLDDGTDRLETAQMVLWLPDKEHDDEFAKHAQSDSDSNPAFRADSPANLAAWLKKQFCMTIG